MTQEELNNRLILIEENIKKVNQQIQQTMANLNLLEGGRQECLYWLSRPVKAQAFPEQVSEIEPVFIPEILDEDQTQQKF